MVRTIYVSTVQKLKKLVQLRATRKHYALSHFHLYKAYAVEGQIYMANTQLKIAKDLVKDVRRFEKRIRQLTR
jgi:hypothetical protein